MLTRILGIFLFLGVCPSLAAAVDEYSAEWLESVREELSGYGESIDSADNSLGSYRSLSGSRKELVLIQGRARECVADMTKSVKTLQERRDVLGETAGSNDAGVTRLQRELDTGVRQGEKLRIACEQVMQVASGLINRIEEHKNAALKARLFVRGMTLLAIADNVVTQPQAWSRLVAGFLDEGSGWERLLAAQKWTAMLAVALALLAGLVWKKQLHAKRKHRGALTPVVAVLPWILPTATASAVFLLFLPEWPPAAVTHLAMGILAWLILGLAVQIWLVGRCARGLPDEDAATLLLWLRLLFASLVVGALVITSGAVIGLPDPHYFLVRTLVAWLMVVGAVWSAILLGRVPGLAGTRGSRVLMVLVVLAVAIAETLGYRNLSIYLLAVFSGTAAGYILAIALSRVATFLYDGLDDGRYAWQRSLRNLMRLNAQETVPGLVWLRLATTLLIWAAFVVWTLWVWGQSDRWLAELTGYFTSGFDVGSMRIEPLKILSAIAILAIGISLSRWIKQSMVSGLVKRSRLDRGGREAIVTLSGYFGVFISVLVALGVAGISYTHLAIIAGALSVGIGFGLQNVVNNFVSGLILLFERPIRTGDWIVVGDTTGYVRKISIRSTQIETFDRADVIVPNSEFIAQKVSNWMLRDPWGRITIPIGVAYGSEVEKVVDILVGIAREHESVIIDQPGVPSPKALFRRFGDSALEFELRCFIRQIDRVFDITHDLNMAIDRKFREAGVTVPFPQRDVHIKQPRDESDE